ncbi:hypothetical protein Vretimale_4224 [Volvox reticuliferus]|uniref:Uncharacterized protein n=1 Tax=Volvox reticuliferus TaxID=1737510 RepID=A0A8J4G435_9CHLO|nr:hypothetical protein Vretimale_4224 [Volvox reticuliferus]
MLSCRPPSSTPPPRVSWPGRVAPVPASTDSFRHRFTKVSDEPTNSYRYLYMHIRKHVQRQGQLKTANFWSNGKSSSTERSPNALHATATAPLTSLILHVSVRSMVIRSTPKPQPPVGGKPYSNAVQKFSSMNIASSSPADLAFA